MAAKHAPSPTYETDAYGWAMEQAALLRARSANAIDWDNIAEEIESVGRSERKEIVNRLEVLVAHLIKLAVSPDEDPRRGWWNTVGTQRLRIEGGLEENPSLRPQSEEMLARAWRYALREVRDGLRSPEEVARVPATPFLSFEQAMTVETDAELRALLPR